MNRIYPLRKRSDFLRISKYGDSVATKGIVILSMKRENCLFLSDDKNDENAVRVGYTVTKKIGNAVVRNRVKRRFRAIAKSIMPDLAVGGYDYVLIARYHSVNRTFSSLQKDMRYALHRLKKQNDKKDNEKTDSIKKDIA